MELMIKELEAFICSLSNAPENEEIAIDITDRAIVGLMICERLGDIAGSMNRLADSMDKFAACVGNTNGYGHRFYIAGDVTCGS